MNVIPIVFSILMLLAIITYAQLQTFVMRSVVRAEYVCHIANRSRENINRLQKQLYEDHQTPGEKKEQSQKVDATSTINLNIFETEPTNPQSRLFYDAHSEIAKRLVDILYRNRQFFQKFETKRPDAVNELMREIIRELRSQKEQGNPIKKAKHLANLELSDPALQEFLAHMLKEVQTPESLTYECDAKGAKKKKAVYYPNLLDFLSAKGSKMQPYRLWLVQGPLLLAIFQDQAVVEAILVERERMYQQLKRATKEQRDQTKNELKMSFETLFQKKLPSNIPEGMVNFDVSLTQPRN